MNAFEHPRKGEGIDPQLVSHLADEPVGGMQSLGGPLHLQALEVAVGRFAVETTEQAAEVGNIQMAGSGHLLDGVEGKKMSIEVLAASLKRRTRPTFRGRAGLGGPGDHDQQQLQLQGRRAVGVPIVSAGEMHEGFAVAPSPTAVPGARWWERSSRSAPSPVKSAKYFPSRCSGEVRMRCAMPGP